MYKIGAIVQSKKYPDMVGIVKDVYRNWEHLKASNRFVTIDEDGESDEMSFEEKLINGDPKDKWLEMQKKPFTSEQLDERWYSVKCLDGGGIWSCETMLQPLNIEYDGRYMLISELNLSISKLN